MYSTSVTLSSPKFAYLDFSQFISAFFAPSRGKFDDNARGEDKILPHAKKRVMRGLGLTFFVFFPETGEELE